jgi:small subunit ribosomal protein S15
MDKEQKQQIIAEWAIKEGDTGSSDVQIALLSARINHLTDHLRSNKHDKHTRRGLMAMVNTRRKLLNYLRRTDPERYTAIRDKLSIRHN